VRASTACAPGHASRRSSRRSSSPSRCRASRILDYHSTVEDAGATSRQRRRHARAHPRCPPPPGARALIEQVRRVRRPGRGRRRPTEVEA
jgi:hypothetical protein